MIFSDYTFLHIFLGSSLLGITAGVLGVFATLRGHSLLGDAISHAAFPGIAAMFLWSFTTHTLLLLLGGIGSALLGVGAVYAITSYTVLKKDAALGIVLSSFFGLGLVLLTMIQKIPTARQAVLHTFLFGNVATLLSEDVVIFLVATIIVLGTLLLFAKEFALIAFDESYARVQGYNVMRYDLLLMCLLVCTVVVGLQTVGVVLISSLLIAPAAAARQWSYSVLHIVLLAALFGLGGCLCGAYMSCSYESLPTGPVIIVALSCIVFLSIFIGPRARNCS